MIYKRPDINPKQKMNSFKKDEQPDEQTVSGLLKPLFSENKKLIKGIAVVAFVVLATAGLIEGVNSGTIALTTSSAAAKTSIQILSPDFGGTVMGGQISVSWSSQQEPKKSKVDLKLYKGSKYDGFKLRIVANGKYQLDSTCKLSGRRRLFFGSCALRAERKGFSQG